MSSDPASTHTLPRRMFIATVANLLLLTILTTVGTYIFYQNTKHDDELMVLQSQQDALVEAMSAMAVFDEILFDVLEGTASGEYSAEDRAAEVEGLRDQTGLFLAAIDRFAKESSDTGNQITSEEQFAITHIISEADEVLKLLDTSNANIAKNRYEQDYTPTRRIVGDTIIVHMNRTISDIRAEREEIGRFRGQASFILIIVITLIFLLNIVLNTGLSRSVRRIINKVSEQAGELRKAKSELEVRVTNRTRDLVTANRELTKAKEKAEAAAISKADFLANMSHEIRTPMNGIIGTTGLLLDTKLHSEQRHYAETTMKSAEALLELINDILDFSKIEAGKIELDIVPFNMLSLVEDTLSVIAPACHEKNIELLLRFAPGTRKFVKGDPGRVRQIIVNLLSNALKFTPEGYIVLGVFSEDTDDGCTNFRIEVTDTGVGIPEDKQDLIFNKFDQADTSTTRKYGGTGLGLSICQDLADMMKGTIGVVSAPEEGSTFWFTIQLEQSPKLPEPKLLADTSILKGLSALIVDDSDISHTIVGEQLQNIGIHCTHADSAAEALDAVKKAEQGDEIFNFIVTDYCMPDMDGEGLAAEIRKHEKWNDTELVLMTSSPRKGDGKHMKKAGFSGYLTKPIFNDEFPAILSTVWQAKLDKDETSLVTRHSIRERSTPEKQSMTLKDANVLVVEDNAINLLVATRLLEAMGCRVTPAGNGQEAVDLMSTMDFNLIFMDCLMPEMDGFDATRKIRELEKAKDKIRIPIIALTANVIEEDQERCLDAGMDDHVGKPVKPDVLEHTLAKWLPEHVEG